MKNVLVRTAFAAALICGYAGAATVAMTTSAAAEDQVSHDVGVALNASLKALQGGDLATANAKVQDAEAAKKSDYDEFKINQVRVAIALQTKDYATADTAYEALIASPSFADFSPDDQKATLKNAIILSGSFQKWSEVIAFGKQLDALHGLDDTTYGTLAVAYYNSKDQAAAADAAQKSIDMAKAAGKTPDPNALTIVANTQAQTNPQAAKATWETMAVENPGDVDTWHNLTALAFGAGVVKNVDALFFCRIDYAVGAMKSADDYTTCASLANLEKDYEEAETLLEAGLKSGKLSASEARSLGDIRSKAAADERIIDAAIKGAHSGEQHLDVAEDLYGYGRYADSISEAQAAKAKGGLKDPGEADLIEAASQARSGQYDAAIQTLSGVDGSGSRKDAAHLWTLYAQAKKKQAQAGNPGGN